MSRDSLLPVSYGSSVPKALKTALDAIEFLPNAVAAWKAAHGNDKELIAVNIKKLREAEKLLGEILASLPLGREYVVFGVPGVSGTFTSPDDLVKALAEQGIKRTGSQEGAHLLSVLIGAPTFDKLIGPIHGGAGVCRYETQGVYDHLSR